MSARRFMLIAGGGTGGHLFPGVAVAGELRRLDPSLGLAFVSAGKALESRVLAEAGYPLEAIKVSALRGAGWWGRVKALAALPGAVLQALGLMAKYRPGCVLAVGGYAAFPLGAAAWLKRVPLMVQEQNAAPGLTNRLLASLARTVFISFAAAGAHFPPEKTRLAGNPVRGELLAQAAEAHGRRPDGDQTFRVLILGGSQGAHSVNLAVAAALPLLAPRRERLHFAHQTGVNDEAMVKRAYEEQGMPGEAAAFFDDVGRQYGLAHLVICRSGAGACCELAAVGRASALVPYPFAAGDHQTLNARAMAEAGAALLVPDAELNGPRVAEIVTALMDDPARRERMEAAARALGRPEAAREIALACLETMREAA